MLSHSLTHPSLLYRWDVIQLVVSGSAVVKCDDPKGVMMKLKAAIESRVL